MPTPPLTRKHAEEILAAAPGKRRFKDVAIELDVNVRTLQSRMETLGIKDEVRAAMAGQDSTRPEPHPEIVGATATVETDIERIRRSAEARFEMKSRRAEQKKHQKVYFPHGPIALFVVSDQHFGSEGCNVARAFAEQEMIMSTPGAYVIQAGDLVDTMIIGKLIAHNFNASLPQWEQWELGQHYLKGFGDRLIAVNSGNHPQWFTRLTGIDYDRAITPDGVLYDADEVNFTVHVGNKQIRIRMRHRWRGRSQYSASHALEKAARFEDNGPDVFIGGHVHEGATAREFVLGGKRKLALMASTYKEIDSYQREQGFVENDSSTAVACVVSDSGAFWGTSNLRSVMEFQRAVYRR